MFGLDQWIAGFSGGTTMLLLVLVAIFLGLRHASDPDHLAAVTTLIASKQERSARSAGALGLAWGSGHATSLFAFGLPIVLYKAYLPASVQRAAETTIGFVIMALVIRTQTATCIRGGRARLGRRTGSASSTGWAAAQASASSCWRRSRIARSLLPRSGCSHSARRSRWRSCRAASASRSRVPPSVAVSRGSRP